MAGSFPHQRLRRLRRGSILRDAAADVHLTLDDLICPLFVSDAQQAQPVASMPEVEQLPVADAVAKVRQLSQEGLRQFILFGVTSPRHKDATGSYAASPDAPVLRALTEIRQANMEALLYADLCFCEYTDHGHCGPLSESDPAWRVDNDRTLELLGQAAVAQARAGADVVAPSGMMDGQVAAVRTALDAAGWQRTAILAYSVKYASGYYGPFREAGGGGMQWGDRRGYQMDFRRAREWRVELEADLSEGADMVMVKPATAYLDILHQVRQACSVPVAAYHVSGEYAMIHAAAQRGWLDLQAAAMETTFAIKRAGADLILSYFAPRMIQWLARP